MSNTNIIIKADLRDNLSKGSTRRMRKADAVPGVVYAKGGNVNISISAKDLPKGHTLADLISLEVGGAKRTVLMREVQVNPITSRPMHIDFQEVTAQDKVSLKVPVEYVGLTREQEKEGAFKVIVRSVMLKGPVGDIPSKVQVNVGGLKADENIYLRDIQIAPTVKVMGTGSQALAQLARK